jgi:very-short-patch-repair endonuclease
VRDQKLLEHAKRLRTEQTPFEQKLWYELRAKRFEGAKFRRQVVIGRYIVDFACRVPSMLIVEVDGDTHGDREKYDAHRTRFLEGRGYRLMRFTNGDVGKNLHGVLTMIAEALKPSPFQGRGDAAVGGEGEEESRATVTLPLSPTLSPEGEREKSPLSPSGESGSR